MQLVNESGTFYLDDRGRRIALTARDLNLFRQMKPMGRKLALRQRAAEKRRADPLDPAIPLMLEFTRRPSREWAFAVPD